MEENSFEEIRKIHLQEKHSPVLSNLSEDFFDSYINYLSGLNLRLKDSFSMEGAKAYENSRKVLLELSRLRCQKIILKAFKDNRSTAVSIDGLATQERQLYLALLKTFSEFEGTLSIFPPREVPEEKVQIEPVKVEVLAEIPEFVSHDGNALGPFQAGAVVFLEQGIARLLAEKGVCKVI